MCIAMQGLINPSSGKKNKRACCTANVCLRQSVNQLHDNQKMTNIVLFPLLARLIILHFQLTSKGYAMNLGSNGMSGSELPYLTRHTNSDLENR